MPSIQPQQSTASRASVIEMLAFPDPFLKIRSQTSLSRAWFERSQAWKAAAVLKTLIFFASGTTGAIDREFRIVANVSEGGRCAANDPVWWTVGRFPGPSQLVSGWSGSCTAGARLPGDLMFMLTQEQLELLRKATVVWAPIEAGVPAVMLSPLQLSGEDGADYYQDIARRAAIAVGEPPNAAEVARLDALVDAMPEVLALPP